MHNRTLAITIGINYLIIFVTAIFANFYVIDALKATPLEMINQHQFLVRLGAVAFLLASFSDIVVAWALKHFYKNNQLTDLSTYFRLTHAVIMAAAVFALLETLQAATASEVLSLVSRFNTLWLIGLFFFGFHLMLLARIAVKPKIITTLLFVAGAMYIVDTSAHFLLHNYDQYADMFLAMVAIPSIFGEMAFGLWMLFKGGKTKQHT